MPADPGRRDPPVFLVTGSSGQIGFELVRELAPLGTVIAPARVELDLSRPASIRETVRRIRPAVIVNAAAFTAVDRAESEREACFAVNAEAPGVLAEEAQRIGAALIHYSTDYVFDGTKTTPYVETDAPRPVNTYGESKLAGERAIEGIGGAWIILRTSWVYGSRGNNFVRTVMRLAREEEELRIVNDQVGCPTWSRSIAVSTAQLLTRIAPAGEFVDAAGMAAGVYHLASAGMASWFSFARAILGHDPCRDQHRYARLTPISTGEYPTPATRPRWSVLACRKILDRFGLALPSWESQLAQMFAAELGGTKVAPAVGLRGRER